MLKERGFKSKISIKGTQYDLSNRNLHPAPVFPHPEEVARAHRFAGRLVFCAHLRRDDDPPSPVIHPVGNLLCRRCLGFAQTGHARERGYSRHQNGRKDARSSDHAPGDAQKVRTYEIYQPLSRAPDALLLVFVLQRPGRFSNPHS